MTRSDSNTHSSSLFAIFPGQGSQHVGMAKELFENFSVAREIFEEASDAVSIDLKKLCFDGPESDLLLTENTQPCLLAASVAAYRVAEREFEFSPGAVAGHSLGEYSALVAIRSLDLGVAARWVNQRGAAMQRAVPVGDGTMAAILGLEDAKVNHLCVLATASSKQNRKSDSEITVTAVVEPANYNAPGQVVIAGSTDAVQEAIALVKSGGEFAGGKAIPLQVSAPFHCSLMRPAREVMADLFAKATSAQRPKALPVPYVPNRTARLSREAGVVLELLVEQVDHPVLWRQSVLSLLDSGFSTSIEFGPGKVLSGLIKRIAPFSSKKDQPVKIAGVQDIASLKNLESVLKPTQPSQEKPLS